MKNALTVGQAFLPVLGPKAQIVFGLWPNDGQECPSHRRDAHLTDPDPSYTF
jgi:hypothetical protein